MVTMGVGPVRSVLLLFAQIQQRTEQTNHNYNLPKIPLTHSCLIPLAQIESVAEPLICHIKIFWTPRLVACRSAINILIVRPFDNDQLLCFFSRT